MHSLTERDKAVRWAAALIGVAGLACAASNAAAPPTRRGPPSRGVYGSAAADPKDQLSWALSACLSTDFDCAAGRCPEEDPQGLEFARVPTSERRDWCDQRVRAAFAAAAPVPLAPAFPTPPLKLQSQVMPGQYNGWTGAIQQQDTSVYSTPKR